MWFRNRQHVCNRPTWTTERVELLKSHFEAGLSCREIAAAIGVSRNAVIGKLSRLESDARTAHAEPRPDKTAKAALRANRSPAAVSDAADVYDRRTAGRTRSRSPASSRCSLFELSEERCRWPISTPGAEDFCFCGNTPLEGMPYCSGHTRLAYRSGSRVARG